MMRDVPAVNLDPNVLEVLMLNRNVQDEADYDDEQANSKLGVVAGAVHRK